MKTIETTFSTIRALSRAVNRPRSTVAEWLQRQDCPISVSAPWNQVDVDTLSLWSRGLNPGGKDLADAKRELLGAQLELITTQNDIAAGLFINLLAFKPRLATAIVTWRQTIAGLCISLAVRPDQTVKIIEETLHEAQKNFAGEIETAFTESQATAEPLPAEVVDAIRRSSSQSRESANATGKNGAGKATAEFNTADGDPAHGGRAESRASQVSIPDQNGIAGGIGRGQ